jgi:hypothetical protein
MLGNCVVVILDFRQNIVIAYPAGKPFDGFRQSRFVIKKSIKLKTSQNGGL